MKIYNLGSMNVDYVYGVDHFVSSGETLLSNSRSVFPGGKGLNQSVALAKAGIKVIHGGRVGDGGQMLLSVLADAGADISRIEECDGPCGHTFIQVDKAGQNCILLFPGSNHAIDRDYIAQFLADAEAGDILVLQNEISGLSFAFEIAHEKKMQIAFNPSPYHEDVKKLPLHYVKWWFCNEIEAAALFGTEVPADIAKRFAEQYPTSNLVLTLGKDGSMYIHEKTCIHQPIYTVETVDTTAAGDTFCGYFLAALTSGKTPLEALDVASKAASIAVTRPGASTSIPTFDEVFK